MTALAASSISLRDESLARLLAHVVLGRVGNPQSKYCRSWVTFRALGSRERSRDIFVEHSWRKSKGLHKISIDVDQTLCVALSTRADRRELFGQTVAPFILNFSPGHIAEVVSLNYLGRIFERRKEEDELKNRLFKNEIGRIVDGRRFLAVLRAVSFQTAETRKPRNARLWSWWAHTDLNRGPKDYESSALTN